MPGTRLVRSLRLKSPRQYVARSCFAIEDALRTASLPGSEHALIVVRSLPLGAVRPGTAPSVLARRIEECWLQQARYAVPAGSSLAASAAAVSFASTAEAYAIYFAQLVRGEPAGEWYWRKLIPQSACGNPAAVFLALARSLARDGAPELARVAVADFAGWLQSKGVLEAGVLGISPSNAEEFLDWFTPGLREAPAHEGAPVVSAYPVQELLLEVLHAAGDRPAWIGSPRELARHVRARLAGLNPMSRRLSPEVDVNDSGKHAHAISEPATPAPERASSTAPSAALESARATSSHAAAESSFGAEMAYAGGTADILKEPSPANPPVSEIEPSAPVGLIPTLGGGIFFALPILRHIGFFDASHALPPFSLERLLLPIAYTAGVPPDDPLVLLLERSLAASEETPAGDILKQYHARACHWARRHPRMLLSWIVRRSAFAAITRSHIDIYFALSQADIRVRRLGLDLDPGWVPELGRVLAYHYDAHRG
jgi:hypothetical protein